MTEFFVKMLELLQGLIDKLPSLSIDSGAVSSIEGALPQIVEFIAKVNYIVPIDTILFLLSIVYGFRVVKFTIFIINWVIRRIADFVP